MFEPEKGMDRRVFDQLNAQTRELQETVKNLPGTEKAKPAESAEPTSSGLDDANKFFTESKKRLAEAAAKAKGLEDVRKTIDSLDNPT